MTMIQFLSFLTTLLFFGTAGYLTAKRFKRPVRVWIVVIVIIATALAVYVGVSVMLVSIFGFTIYLNWALSAFGLGMVFNLLIRGSVPALH